MLLKKNTFVSMNSTRGVFLCLWVMVEAVGTYIWINKNGLILKDARLSVVYFQTEGLYLLETDFCSGWPLLPHTPCNPYDRQTACFTLIHFTLFLSIHSQFPSLSAHIACLAAYIHISTYTQRPQKDNLLLSIKGTVAFFFLSAATSDI